MLYVIALCVCVAQGLPLELFWFTPSATSSHLTSSPPAPCAMSRVSGFRSSPPSVLEPALGALGAWRDPWGLSRPVPACSWGGGAWRDSWGSEPALGALDAWRDVYERESGSVTSISENKPVDQGVTTANHLPTPAVRRTLFLGWSCGLQRVVFLGLILMIRCRDRPCKCLSSL